MGVVSTAFDSVKFHHQLISCCHSIMCIEDQNTLPDSLFSLGPDPKKPFQGNITKQYLISTRVMRYSPGLLGWAGIEKPANGEGLAVGSTGLLSLGASILGGAEKRPTQNQFSECHRTRRGQLIRVHPSDPPTYRVSTRFTENHGSY